MKKHILITLICIAFSCKYDNNAKEITYTLEETSNHIQYNIDKTSSDKIKALFTYEDEDKEEYLSFQDFNKNNISFYNLNTGDFAFKISPKIEGSNGVGNFIGYYIHNLDSIYLTIPGKSELIIIDRNANIIDRILYEQTSAGKPLYASLSISFTYKPIINHENILYIISECNRTSKQNTVTATIDIKNKEIKHLPFNYPVFPSTNDKSKMYGIESYFSRCFDGNNFIYSFYFKEDIYVATKDHTKVRKIKAKSKFINQINLPNEEPTTDFKKSLTEMCSFAYYGNLIYDKYRNIYYRIAYPSTEINKNENILDIWNYGRKDFSIIILDKDFKKIGETRLPSEKYNSKLMFINKKGLYISTNYYNNSNYNENSLNFTQFYLNKTK